MKLYWQLRRAQQAARVADITYSLWERWHNLPANGSKRMALRAKAIAVVQWDRMMFGGR